MRPQPPVLTDQARTSVEAQRQIEVPPAPFGNKNSMAQSAPPTHPAYRSTGNAKELNYQSTRVGCANTSLSADEMAAIGYGPKDTTSAEPIISGRPLQNRERQSGMPGTRSKSASSREVARMRQSPIKLY
jgi:hypothetical protein